MMGYVYVLAGPNGERKIGYAKNLSKRVGTLTPALPWPVELEISYNHRRARTIEALLHKILADARIRGEWFRCSLDRILSALPLADTIVQHKEGKKGSFRRHGRVFDSFARRLTREREARSLTQTEIAERLGFTRSAWAGWERGARQPDLQALVQICEFLRISSDDLLGISSKKISA